MSAVYPAKVDTGKNVCSPPTPEECTDTNKYSLPTPSGCRGINVPLCTAHLPKVDVHVYALSTYIKLMYRHECVQSTYPRGDVHIEICAEYLP